MHEHALVIGKFYPPHKGHIYLIEQARKAAHRVTVLVYGSSYQSVPGSQRAQWIREAFTHKPGIHVKTLINDMYEDYDSPEVWEAHDAILKAYLRNLKAAPVDLIVSSEPYGEEMAQKYFGGIDFLLVDQPRINVPISATKIRENLVKNWKFLPDSTKNGLIPRIVVVGAESTGTTTLSTALSEHYNARWVWEAGRYYTFEKLAQVHVEDRNAGMEDMVWTEEDFAEIGRRQNVAEFQIAVSDKPQFPLLISDTDAYATAVWEYRYIGTPIDDALRLPYANNLPKRDLYIITDHEGVDFEQDGIRDGQDTREWMTRMFEDTLTQRGESWVKIRGDKETRLKIAITLIDKILETKYDFN